VFNRWYTAAPLCAPSRACLLTGRYTIHNTVRNNAVDLPASEVTLAEALKPLGYETALVGKWHHGVRPEGGFTHPLEQGFDSTFGYLDARHAWEHFPKQLWRGRESVPVSGYSADILSDEAARFLRRTREQPFFLYLAYIEPHFHVEAPEEDVARFRGKFREKDPKEPYNARYAAMLNRLDAAIGRVLRVLEETGQADNTLVVFSSDNGATFESGNRGASAYHDSNRPFRGQKRSLEEGGIRMPAIVRWPGKAPAGRKSEEVIHMTDVFPSFVAAAGGEVEGRRDEHARRLDGPRQGARAHPVLGVPHRGLQHARRHARRFQTARDRRQQVPLQCEGRPPGTAHPGAGVPGDLQAAGRRAEGLAGHRGPAIEAEGGLSC